MPESKLHRFLKQEILPYDAKVRNSLLYEQLKVWFVPRIDKKLGHTLHRPDIYYRCPRTSKRKTVLLLGEVETGGGNYWWNLRQTEPIIKQQWANHTVLFQVFFPTCRKDWVDASLKEGKRLERKYEKVHFYPFKMEINEERAFRIYSSFRKGHKKKNDLMVLRRETNRINAKLLNTVRKLLVC